MTHIDDGRLVRGTAVIAKAFETETGYRPSVRTVRRWIAKGLLPVTKIGGPNSPCMASRGAIRRAARGENQEY